MQAPYNTITATRVSPSEDNPQIDNISFSKGDQKTLKYLFKNLAFTETRPLDAYDLPMYSADEITAGVHTTELDPVAPVVDDGTGQVGNYSFTNLVVDWRQSFWHAQIRSAYTATYRMYNGWVPWYGRRPQWSWWNRASLRGVFDVTAEYSSTEDGTIVTCILPSLSSSKIYPGDVYAWDLQSSRPVWDEGLDPEVDDPSSYTAIRTWVGGSCKVLQDWTHGIPIS